MVTSPDARRGMNLNGTPVNARSSAPGTSTPSASKPYLIAVAYLACVALPNASARVRAKLLISSETCSRGGASVPIARMVSANTPA